MRVIRKIVDRLIDISAFIGAFSILAMMIHITIDVISRAFFNSPMSGTVTFVSHYYMVICAFLSLALAERRDAHISVEVFTELMPQSTQRHLASWFYLLSFGVFGFLTYRTAFDTYDKFAMGSFQIEGDLAIVMWPSHLVLPVGFGLMALVVLLRFVDYLTGASPRSGDGRTEGKPVLD